MKKKSLPLAVATAALLGGSGLAAHAEGLYIGGAIGQPNWRDSVNGIDGSNSGTALKLYGGYGFTPNFALEAGAVHLGRLAGTAGEAKAHGAFVDGVGTLPLTSDWSLLGRIGIADIKTTTSTGSDSGTATKLGLGVQYQLTKSAALRGEWERYRLSAFGSHPDADQWTIGVKWGF